MVIFQLTNMSEFKGFKKSDGTLIPCRDDSKQPTLTTQQLAAVNSGVTAEKVAKIATIDERTANVSQLARDVSQISDDKLEVDSVKDNGNIVLKDGAGNKKEYMAATPSGDPMHYAYIKAGAEYNDTGSDITKTAPWGDSVLHKSGMWYLNGLGDISNEEMSAIYSRGVVTFTDSNSLSMFSEVTKINSIRTNISIPYYEKMTLNSPRLSQNNNKIEVISLPSNLSQNTENTISGVIPFSDSKNLKYIIGIFSYSNSYNPGLILKTLPALVYANWKGIKFDVQISSASNFRTDCIAYMINNVGTTNAVSITLHATAYARAIANSDVQSALAAHTNVSLVSA